MEGQRGRTEGFSLNGFMDLRICVGFIIIKGAYTGHLHCQFFCSSSTYRINVILLEAKKFG